MTQPFVTLKVYQQVNGGSLPAAVSQIWQARASILALTPALTPALTLALTLALALTRRGATEVSSQALACTASSRQ